MPGAVNVAVVRLPHISNFTDFNVLNIPGRKRIIPPRPGACRGRYDRDSWHQNYYKSTCGGLRLPEMDEAITGLAADGLLNGRYMRRLSDDGSRD